MGTRRGSHFSALDPCLWSRFPLLAFLRGKRSHSLRGHLPSVDPLISQFQLLKPNLKVSFTRSWCFSFNFEPFRLLPALRGSSNLSFLSPAPGGRGRWQSWTMGQAQSNGKPSAMDNLLACGCGGSDRDSVANRLFNISDLHDGQDGGGSRRTLTRDELRQSVVAQTMDGVPHRTGVPGRNMRTDGNLDDLEDDILNARGEHEAWERGDRRSTRSSSVEMLKKTRKLNRQSSTLVSGPSSPRRADRSSFAVRQAAGGLGTIDESGAGVAANGGGGGGGGGGEHRRQRSLDEMVASKRRSNVIRASSTTKTI